MPPKLGVIAGGGELPARIIDACRETGRECFVIAFEGQTAPDLFKPENAGADVPHAWVRLGAAGTALQHLRDAGVEELVMAGAIRRPSLKELRPDLWATKFFAASGAASLGDDGLLKALIRALEGEGFSVVGVDSLLPDILAPAGVYGRHGPDPQALADIAAARTGALSLGRADRGQGAVARGGQVLLLEDEAGTDAMLAKVRGLSGGETGGVLVKMCKPGQESRADLPTIGVNTVRAAADAGLKGIAVEAGKSLVIDMQAVVDAADEAGLFITGIDGEAPLIYLIAGEASGDILGGRLMQRLKEKSPDLRFAGIGGAKMREQGLESLFPMEELSLMGLAEILPHIPKLLKRIDQTVADIESRRPAVLLTIDAPGFCFRVARKVRNKAVRKVHYVAPSVWAWKPGRAKKVAGFLDHLLALLPFEPPYFERVGLATTFVGHSVVEGRAGKGDGAAFRRRHGIGEATPVLVMLPGSRRGEVERLLPVFCQTAKLLRRTHPGLVVVLPTLKSLSGKVRDGLEAASLKALVVAGDEEKFDAFAAADVALAASGTVALELAMAETPTVIGYKVHPVTAWLVRRLIKTPYVNLINIVLGREAVPEFLQQNCRPEAMQAALASLLDDEARAREQRDAAELALRQMGKGGESPSGRAAEAVLSILQGDGNHE